MKKDNKFTIYVLIGVLSIILILITIKIKDKATPEICQVNGKVISTLEILLPISCSNAGLFDNVYYGYANVRGEIVLLDKSWIHTTPFNDHYFAIVTNNENQDAIINKKGRIIMDFNYDEIIYLGEKMYFLKKINETDEKYYLGTYINGKINIKEVYYNFIYDFNEGLAAVISNNNDKIGYINEEGELIIPAIYDKNTMISHQFLKNRAVVIFNGKYGVIDKDNKTIIPFIYDYIQPVNKEEGFIKFKRNSKYGFMNYSYEEIIPPVYQSISSDSEGIAAVSVDDENFAFFEIELKQLLTKFWYKRAISSSFINNYNYYQYGYAVVTKNGESFNLVNKEGEYILYRDYLGIKVINKDYIVVKDSDFLYHVININNMEIVCTFEAFDILVYKGYPFVSVCSENNEEGATMYKLYDLSGEEIVENLKVNEYMMGVNIEGHNFLYFNGEKDGHLFSSYINEENELLFQPW